LSILIASKFEDRDDLYYGQFLYQARFFLRESSCLRELDHDKIDRTVAWRDTWVQRTRKPIAADIKNNLHTVCDQLLALKNPYKKVIYQNWVYIYTSSFDDIVSLSLGPMELRSTSQANVTHPKNTVGLKNPRHKFRTYVRAHKPTPEQKQSLASFIAAAGEDVRAGPGLKDFLSNNRYLWMQDHYFIDHNEMSMVTALALINPKLIRKTMSIVQVNN